MLAALCLAGLLAPQAALAQVDPAPQQMIPGGVWDPYQQAQSERLATLGWLFGNRGQQVQSPVAAPPPIVYEPGCVDGQTMPPGAPVAPYVPPALVAPAPPPAVAPPPVVAPPPPPTSYVPYIASVWYAEAEAQFLTRDNRASDRALVLFDLPPDNTDNSALRVNDFSFDYEVGPRLLVGYAPDRFSAFEGSYFGIYNWDAQRTVVGDNDLNLPGDLGLSLDLDFFNADRFDVDIQSDIHNAELNYLWNYDTAALLVGFRYFHLTEELNIVSTDLDTGSSLYAVRTRNNLFGGQVGVRLEPTYGAFSCRLEGKAGLFGNAARQKQRVTDFEGFIARETATSDEVLSFIGELRATAVYRLSQTWALQGGYGVMWVERVALAFDQLDFTDDIDSGTAIDRDGGVFIHGAHAGLAARW